MIAVGIDPGITGAIAFMQDDGTLLHVDDMPWESVLIAGTERRTVSAAVFCRTLVKGIAKFTGHGQVAGHAHVFLERLTAMPSVNNKTGARDRQPSPASMMAFGRGGGIIEGACAMAGLSITVVAPATWKLAMRCPSGKDMARVLTLQTFPTHAEWFKRKMDHGRAEATLIALWGTRQLPRR